LTHIFKKGSGWPEHFKVDLLGDDDPYILDP
jgi:alpha-mannosidase